MSIEKAKAYLAEYNLENNVLEFEVSSATVELAAKALDVEPARIAKSLSFKKDENKCILIICAGDVRIDNKKFKDFFGFKAKMLSPDEVLSFTNHSIGGVCPFGINSEKVEVYLDSSLQRFETVFPACGSSNSAIELNCNQLEKIAQSIAWINICS